jgi:hypothetical protein
MRCDNIPVCIVAKTPQALNTHESIRPEQKQQRMIGIDVNERLISRDHKSCALDRGSEWECFSLPIIPSPADESSVVVGSAIRN